jgi:hypothetical protein
MLDFRIIKKGNNVAKNSHGLKAIDKIIAAVPTLKSNLLVKFSILELTKIKPNPKMYIEAMVESLVRRTENEIAKYERVTKVIF